MSRIARLLIVGLLLASTLAALSPAPGALADASVTLNPTSGPPGSSVAYKVTGFQPNEAVAAVWDYGVNLSGGVADSSGSYSGSFQVPSNAGLGSHEVQVVDPGALIGPVAGTQFEVVEGATPTPVPPTPTPKPNCQSYTLSMSQPPDHRLPGSQVALSGSGFVPNGQLRILGVSGSPIPPIAVGSSGGFGVNFTIPQDAPPGQYQLTFAEDVGQQQSVCTYNPQNPPFILTVVAPTTPTPAPPANCAGDEAMSFNPSNPAAGQQVTAMVTSAQPSTNVQLNGPFNPQGPSVSRGGKGYIWSWTFTPDSQGQYTYGFTVNGGGTCTSGTLPVGPPQQQNQPQPTSGCAGDEAMSFNPANPTVGQQVTISVTSARASVNVGLSGPFNPVAAGIQTGGKGYIWSWAVTPDSPGQYNYNFTVNNGASICTSNFVAVGPSTAAPTATATPPASTPNNCQFVLGFKTLHDLIPDIVGNCTDDEQHTPSTGDTLQHTTKGLLVWRKLDNWTAFTDGYRTWINGPNGVQERLNACRFSWEANPDNLPICGNEAAPTPTPVPFFCLGGRPSSDCPGQPTPTPAPTLTGFGKTTVEQTLDYVPADGLRKDYVTVHLRDDGGRAVPGQQVTLTIGPGSTLGPGSINANPTQTTNQSGDVSFTVTANKPGTVNWGFSSGTVALQPTITTFFTVKRVILLEGIESDLSTAGGYWCCDQDYPNGYHGSSVDKILKELGYDHSHASFGKAQSCPTSNAEGIVDDGAVLDFSYTGGATCVADNTVMWIPLDFPKHGIFAPSPAEMGTILSSLKRMIADYDTTYYLHFGYNVSFYLVGHSLGGKIAFQFEGGDAPKDLTLAELPRGEVASVVTVDSPINGWYHLDTPTLLPAAKTANELVAQQAATQYGTLTATVTNTDDTVVSPDEALVATAAYSQQWSVGENGQPHLFEPGAGHVIDAASHGSLLHPTQQDTSQDPSTDAVFHLANVLAGTDKGDGGEPPEILGPAVSGAP